MPSVSPEVLRWARDTAGLSPDDAARKLGIKSSLKASASQKIEALETGEVQPSVSLLRRMAKQYRRPLVSFYLAKPPARGERGEDFRTLPEGEHKKTDPLVEALLRDIKARQDMVRSLLLEEEDTKPLSFVASCVTTDGPSTVADKIVQDMGFELTKFRSRTSVDQSFTYLRELAERRGVFVVLAGNLGTHHTSIEVEAFRGFALADEVAPFVLINDQDARSAWSFTLLHELAHIWLGRTGVSGERIETQVERFCSDVASSILLPDIETFDFGASETLDQRVELIGQFANARKISASMVCYRLHLSGRISAGEWRLISSRFRELWLQSREQTREKARQSESGPNYYVVRRHRLGDALLNVVGRYVSEGTLTPTKAGKVLGVKARSVAPLLNITNPRPRAA